jgi:hypothetical protein
MTGTKMIPAAGTKTSVTSKGSVTMTMMMMTILITGDGLQYLL